MIVFENVSKFFYEKNKKKYIFKNISFKIPQNLNVAILGTQGSGKSTLLKLFGKIMYPNYGTIESTVTFSWPLGAYGGFSRYLTGKDNVKFVCRLYSLNEIQMRETLKYVKDFSELGSFFDKPLHKYTTEMKQRLSFSLNLALHFDYTLVDERLIVGNDKFKQKALDHILKKIKQSNVILISKNLKRVRTLCDIGLVINEGHVYYYKNINDAISAYIDLQKRNK